VNDDVYTYKAIVQTNYLTCLRIVDKPPSYCYIS